MCLWRLSQEINSWRPQQTNSHQTTPLSPWWTSTHLSTPRCTMDPVCVWTRTTFYCIPQLNHHGQLCSNYYPPTCIHLPSTYQVPHLPSQLPLILPYLHMQSRQLAQYRQLARICNLNMENSTFCPRNVANLEDFPQKILCRSCRFFCFLVTK